MFEQSGASAQVLGTAKSEHYSEKRESLRKSRMGRRHQTGILILGLVVWISANAEGQVNNKNK